VVDGPEDPTTYTRFGFGPGPGAGAPPAGHAADAEYPAVTVALAKRLGANAVRVADAIAHRLDAIRGTILPDGVEVRVTRDYGETADHKVNELVKHLAIAVATVVVLLGLALGWREAGVVALAVPTTLAVTLGADLVFGYSINRVTLFALILSLGLLVDDPIVDVENIYRHFKLREHPPLLATLVAVDEIRPPTILATFTVIVSFLPMFFITGMMGPYMAPMAFNVPVAMLTSLLVAFTITPWAAYHALRHEYDTPAEPFDLRATGTYRWYARVVRPLLHEPRRARRFLAGVGLAFAVAVALVPLGAVPVKMLPFDNKNELLLVVDMPEGTPLERTDAALADLGATLRKIPEVRDYQTFAGVAAPIDFNGLVRHYFLRAGGHVGDLRVNLLAKEERAWQSHAIALRLRPAIERVAATHGARVKIVETPPGPPVLSTLVAEVRGPVDAPYEDVVAAGARVLGAFAQTPGVSDVDWTIEDERERIDVRVERDKAALHGIPVEAAAATVRLALAGGEAGASARAAPRARADPARLPQALRADVSDVLALRVRGAAGGLVPLGEIARVARLPEERTIFHKDLRPLVYVTGEPVGISPVTALSAVDERARAVLPPGYAISWRGEGEWKITTEVFRDLGLAFAAALLGIYVLLVAQTGSLVVPLVIMLAIPLTMIGVFPGFFALNLLFAWPVGTTPNPVFFTAPGMIGLIALAGIVVRNSIILIDFIEVLRRSGRDLEEAIVEAGATRLRPILLTAGAALFGAWVIVLDPIFSGLAWAFIFGIFASTGFTLLVVPTVYAMLARRGRAAAAG
jgi:multidrug efflux pump subunit AcrB